MDSGVCSALVRYKGIVRAYRRQKHRMEKVFSDEWYNMVDKHNGLVCDGAVVYSDSGFNVRGGVCRVLWSLVSRIGGKMI